MTDEPEQPAPVETTPLPAPPPGVSDAGAAALDQRVAAAVQKGWSVESRSTTQAVLVKGKKPNHILHLILSIITFGLWIPVWIILSLTMKVERGTLTLGADGVVRNPRGR